MRTLPALSVLGTAAVIFAACDGGSGESTCRIQGQLSGAISWQSDSQDPACVIPFSGSTGVEMDFRPLLASIQQLVVELPGAKMRVPRIAKHSAAPAAGPAAPPRLIPTIRAVPSDRAPASSNRVRNPRRHCLAGNEGPAAPFWKADARGARAFRAPSSRRARACLFAVEVRAHAPTACAPAPRHGAQAGGRGRAAQ